MADLEIREWDDLKGPGRIPCEHKCEIPEGVTLKAFPETRHMWEGVLHCPNRCGRCFVMEAEDEDYIERACVISWMGAGF